MALPVGWIRISQLSNILSPRMSKCLEAPAPTISVKLKMFDSCEIRIHPTGKAIARFGTKSQGQGHETTYAQILAEELGIPAKDIQVEEGDTDTAPYGLGTYASRSTPVAGAAAAVAAR